MKTGLYADREVQIHRDLTKLVAARDGFDLTRDKGKWQAESAADDLLQMWPRNRRDPQDEIERLCEANCQNERAWQAYRSEIQAIRDAHSKAVAPPPPDPNFVTLVINDRTNQVWEITLPSHAVKLRSGKASG